MSDQTNISWSDSTFNPWMGCTKVSSACDHCYAERDTKRFGRVEWGAGKPRSRTSTSNWKKVEAWNNKDFMSCTSCAWRGELRDCTWNGEQCPECGGIVEIARRRVFSASLGDWLDNEVPIEWFVDFLDLIRRTPNLDWLLLTKRIGNFEKRIDEADKWVANNHTSDEPWAHEIRMFMAFWKGGTLAPPNVWIGATVVNQEEANRDVEKLLSMPATIRFLSIEPMLGVIDLDPPICPECGDREFEAGGDGITPFCSYCDDSEMCFGNWLDADKISWVICGGESGPHARPLHPDWVRSLRSQCEDAGVPFHFKQWGEWTPYETGAGKDLGGDLRSGRVMHLHAPGNPEGHFTRGDAYVERVGKKLAGNLIDGTAWQEFPA